MFILLHPLTKDSVAQAALACALTAGEHRRRRLVGLIVWVVLRHGGLWQSEWRCVRLSCYNGTASDSYATHLRRLKWGGVALCRVVPDSNECEVVKCELRTERIGHGNKKKVSCERTAADER